MNEVSSGFWSTLPKPFFVLAPLANVTDAAFRRVIAKYGKPHALWTEFVSADGLFMGGKDALMIDLEYTEAERPIVAQFFTSRPENMEKGAALARELGFDGVDINMGCPDRAVEKQKSGAALIKNSNLAKELIAAAKQGAKHLPVSVKTRIGYNKNELETWLPALLEAKPAALTLHARTRKEMSKVPAHWDQVKRAVEIRSEVKSEALIVGNGDARDLSHARELIEETGAEGIMLGRAIFGKPWLFSEETPSLPERLRVMVEHTKLFEELFKGKKNFATMKKHYKAYVSGFDGAADLRATLMDAENAAEVEKAVLTFIHS